MADPVRSIRLATSTTGTLTDLTTDLVVANNNNMYKKKSKFMRVSSPPHNVSQTRDSDDDSTSMSSYGSCVGTSSNRISDFGYEKSVDNR